MHYQWQNRYQGFSGVKPLHSWQQEGGCPIPRPRSFSLSSIGSHGYGHDLMEVSTRRTIVPSATILPLETRDKCVKSEYSYSKRKGCKTANITCWITVVCLVMTSLLGVVFISRMKTRSLKASPHVFTPNLGPKHVDQRPPHSQLPQQMPPQNVHHPLHPPAPSLSRSVPHVTGYSHHVPPQHYSPQQQQPPPIQFQHIPQNHYPPEVIHMYHYNPHNIHQNVHPYSPVIPNAQQHPNTHQNFQGQQWPSQQEFRGNVEHPFHQHKMPEHVHINNLPHDDNQRNKPVTSPPTRQEERAHARNEARNANAKNKTKSLPKDDIWEEEPLLVNKTKTSSTLRLRLEPAMFSYKEFFQSNDGILFITSHEDEEEMTIEVVEEE